MRKMNIDETIKRVSKETAKEVIQDIKKATKEVAKEVVQELKNSRYLKNDISYFRRVELLLYNRETLQYAIKQKDEDIEYIKEHGLPEKSGSIVIFQTSGGNISGQERYAQMIEKYKLEKMETERELNRIENALDKIKKDKYYTVIEYKYLVPEEERMTDEQLAEKLRKDQSTITRNKKRLINKLKGILFTDSIKEFA